MSTKSSLFYGEDVRNKGTSCHIYWELAERIPGKAAPIFIGVKAEGRQVEIRLPVDIARQIRSVLEPYAPGELEVI